MTEGKSKGMGRLALRKLLYELMVRCFLRLSPLKTVINGVREKSNESNPYKKGGLIRRAESGIGIEGGRV